jgi:uncharacterized membrane protein YgdD (TMEM256/DUF423 family)
MIRAWLAASAVVGFLSVTAGAIGAHLATGDRTAELLRTGALYGLAHGAALIGLVAISHGRDAPGPALVVAGRAFAIGILLFSLSLFALSLFALGLTGIEWLGVITPYGGAGLLIGWSALLVHAFHRRR